MKNAPELSELARNYEDFLHNPDAIARFEKTEVFVEGFRKVFRKHARVMAEFWQERDLVVPHSARAPYLKYTDAYMQMLYDDERLNHLGDRMTWGTLCIYLDAWELIQYRQMFDQAETTENAPNSKSPSV